MNYSRKILQKNQRLCGNKIRTTLNEKILCLKDRKLKPLIPLAKAILFYHIQITLLNHDLMLKKTLEIFLPAHLSLRANL